MEYPVKLFSILTLMGFVAKKPRKSKKPTQKVSHRRFSKSFSIPPRKMTLIVFYTLVLYYKLTHEPNYSLVFLNHISCMHNLLLILECTIILKKNCLITFLDSSFGFSPEEFF